MHVPPYLHSRCHCRHDIDYVKSIEQSLTTVIDYESSVGTQKLDADENAIKYLQHLVSNVLQKQKLQKNAKQL